jgi:hypothetical protein
VTIFLFFPDFYLFRNGPPFQSQSYVTTDGQSVSLSCCQAPSKAQTRYLLLSDNCGFVDVGALSADGTHLPFTIAAGPRQKSFLRPSPAVLIMLLYSFRFETTPIWREASYSSENHGTTDSQSAGRSLYQVPSGATNQIFLLSVAV